MAPRRSKMDRPLFGERRDGIGGGAAIDEQHNDLGRALATGGMVDCLSTVPICCSDVGTRLEVHLDVFEVGHSDDGIEIRFTAGNGIETIVEEQPGATCLLGQILDGRKQLARHQRAFALPPGTGWAGRC